MRKMSIYQGRRGVDKLIKRGGGSEKRKRKWGKIKGAGKG